MQRASTYEVISFFTASLIANQFSQHLLSPYTDNDKTTLSVSSSDSRTSPL